MGTKANTKVDRYLYDLDKISQKKPSFVYQNMVKLISTTPVTADYDFIERIGKGSFSQVFKAINKKTKNMRAIKKVDRHKNLKLQSLLLNEFDILKQMDHPNVLKMYGLYEEYTYFYIVTELCKGKELFEVIMKQKRFKEKQAAQIFYQLCSAMRYLHLNKVMHRDLKPENIIYDENNKVLKLIDFGSAVRFESSEIVERRRIGTSYYIAPEVLKKRYNEKCDVWSAGVLLHILLGGQPLFCGPNDQVILKKVQEMELELDKGQVWKQISSEAKDLISGMIERNVSQRFTMQKVMEHKWFQNMLKKQSNITGEESENMIECLKNMSKFKEISKQNVIQEGMLIFIVNFVRNNKDQVQLMKSFKALDLNGDGVLSLQQLQIGMATYLKVGQIQALQIAKKIFEKVDTNNSGFIDYSEFIVSAVSVEVMISQDNLDVAFDYMDYDKSGTLSLSEIRECLGENIQQDAYVKLITEFDKDHDGQISRTEFKGMMKRLMERKK